MRAPSSHQTETWRRRPLSFQLAKAWGWDSHHPSSHLPMPSEKSEPVPPYKGLQPSSRVEVTLCYRANKKSFTALRPKQGSLEVNIRAIRLELGHCASRTFPGTACVIAKHNRRELPWWSHCWIIQWFLSVNIKRDEQSSGGGTALPQPYNRVITGVRARETCGGQSWQYPFMWEC